MAITLLVSETAGGLNGATTAAIDTTGATLIVVEVANYNGDATATRTLSDSASNTWTKGNDYIVSGQGDCSTLYYCLGPTTSATHTFTIAATGVAPTIAVAAFSGTVTSSGLDSQTGEGNANVTYVEFASTFTPSENNCLIVSGCVIGASVSSFAAASGSTLIEHQNFVAATSYGVGLLYQVQTTATQITADTDIATWTTAANAAVSTMVFKAASGDSVTCNPATVLVTGQQATVTQPAALTSGTASFTSATSSAISVSVTAATGGTSPYTYQWYRATTANFTPGAGNLLSGATSTNLSDSTASADTVYYYKCVATDSAGTPATVTSNQVAGALLASTVIIGCLGDSITKGTAGPNPASVTVTQRLASQLQSMYKQRAVTVVNQGVDTASAQDFAADTGSIFSTAKTAFSNASCTHIMIMLGANDAADHRTAAQFLTDMQTIIGPGTGSLITAGYKVIVNYPTYIPAGANSGATDEAATENMRSYLAQIDSLVDGVDVLRGDTLAYQYFVDHPTEVQTDQTHLLDAGNISLANMWARAFDRAVLQREIGRASLNIGV